MRSQVSKIRVNAGELRLDWLGLRTFRQVAIAEGEVFDIETDYLAGELACDEPFDGNKLLWDWQRWRVRPGDLVGVELPGGQTRSGFFVPMDAISVRGDKTYVFVVRDGRAIQMEVTTLKGPNTLRRIEAVGSEPFDLGDATRPRRRALSCRRRRSQRGRSTAGATVNLSRLAITCDRLLRPWSRC